MIKKPKHLVVFIINLRDLSSTGLICMHSSKDSGPFCWWCIYKSNVLSPWILKIPILKKTIRRSRPTSGASWWQAYVFDPCGTYMPFTNTCLLEERCTAAASWWGKPGAGSACVTGRLLFPFHRWLISLWRLGTARAECMQLFLRSLPLAALWLPD